MKTIDFWINSFPTSGGTDIEAAYVSKPSIEMIFNRNLTLHPTEFLCSNECIVHNHLELKKLIVKFIKDRSYRRKLGKYLSHKVKREYNKERLISEKVYGSFIDELNEKKNKNNKINLNEKFNDSIEYEKHIALYNTIINKKSYSERIKFLKKTVECFPNKIFAWIKILEISILKKDKSLFNFMLKEIPLKTIKDIRIQFLKI